MHIFSCFFLNHARDRLIALALQVVLTLFFQHRLCNCCNPGLIVVCLSLEQISPMRKINRIFSVPSRVKALWLFVCTESSVWHLKSLHSSLFNLFYCRQLCMSYSKQNAYLYWISRQNSHTQKFWDTHQQLRTHIQSVWVYNTKRPKRHNWKRNEIASHWKIPVTAL